MKRFLTRQAVVEATVLALTSRSVKESMMDSYKPSSSLVHNPSFSVPPPEISRYAKNYLGQSFGQLIVLSQSSRNQKAWVYARCACGQYWEGLAYHLTSGKTLSCGCHLYQHLIGKTFHRLTIVGITLHAGRMRASCLCQCGQRWDGQLGVVLDGRQKSCGCLLHERRRRNYTGQRFGRLIVLGMMWEPDLRREREGRLLGIATCHCVCGTIKSIPSHNLTGVIGTRSCGCSARNDYSKQRFGRLVVQCMVKEERGTRHVYKAECLCDCGQTVRVSQACLKNGRTQSCGCLKKDWLQSLRKPLQHKKEVSRLGRHRRRALLKHLPMNFTQTHLDFMLHYWKFSCAVCDREDGGLWHIIAIDHFIPITSSECPGTVPGNMLPLCQTRKGGSKHVDTPGCNHNKWKKDPLAWLEEKLGKLQAKRKLAEIHAYFAAAEAYAASRKEVA